MLIMNQLDADLLSLLYDNVTRLDEVNESDRAGLFHILGMNYCLYATQTMLI